MSDFTLFREKMQAAEVSEAAIRAFERNYLALIREESGMIDEQDISPCESLPNLDEVTQNGGVFDPVLLAQTVVIKLNGGLGTSMGLQKAKSLLPVKDDTTFLDIIAQQILHLREQTGAKVRFLLMDSFSTSEDTLEHMKDYEDQDLAGAENIELMQNQVPKINAANMEPVEWEKKPSYEWCPPGHGDLYAALTGSGWLDQLLTDGVKYAFVSNADNLGAVLDSGLLRYFADSDKPFLMEATRRTEADKKGLEQEDGVIPLPMIRNKKTVDPRDKESTPVYQLEIAMGAAIESFPGSGAVCVPRSRFAPVKTTSDLFALRSDAYEQTADGRIALLASRNGKPPVIDLIAGGTYKNEDVVF